MEDTLRAIRNFMFLLYSISLNPCFNGRYSQSDRINRIFDPKKVLILVLMEDTLRELLTLLTLTGISLNPCFNGRYSQRMYR